jgi:hypothetical protein
VIRTDFEDQKAWKTICKLIRAPVPAFGDAFYAYVQFLDDEAFRGLSAEELLDCVPSGYKHSYFFVVDAAAIGHPEFALLVVDLRGAEHRKFRAIPAAVQAIENNLSIANMDFFEFAGAVDEDGVFRGFPSP